MKNYVALIATTISLLVLGAASAPAQPTVTTDQADYPPGSTVHITGTGFQAGESVQCQILRIDCPENSGPEHVPWTVTADGDGNFQTTWVVSADELGATLQLTATGLSSGLVAQMIFTDSSSTTTTITSSANPSTYGQAGVTFTATVTGPGTPTGTIQFATNGVAFGSAITLSAGVAISSALPTTLALGTYTITAHYHSDSNGTWKDSDGTLSGGQVVSKAALTVTASAQSKTYGQTLTFGSGSSAFTSSGLKNSDTIGTVTLACSGGTATAGVSGSPYTITPSAATGGTFTAGNYNITYAPGNLTVNRAGLTVTADAKSRVYGAPDPTFTATITGFVAGDGDGVVTGSPSFSTTATSSSSVSGSPYTITATQGTLAAANYTFSFATGNLSITPASTTAAVATDQWTVQPASNVTFSVMASASSPSTAVPSGSVQFVANGTNNLGSPIALVSGQATLTVIGSALAHGSNSITAVIPNPDGNFSGCSGDLTPQQVVNNPPNSGTHALGAVINKPSSFTAAQLAGLDKDPDKDSLTVSAVSAAGTNGGAISMVDGTITYTPPANYAGSDSFNYTITDPFGGVTNCTLNVTIRLGTSTSAINHIVAQPDGNQKLVAFGIPGKTYMIQASSDMVNWANLTTNVVPSSSVIVFFDLTATNYPSRFYRLFTQQ